MSTNLQKDEPGGAGRAAPDRSGPPVLRLSGISKRFGAVQALTDVDLEVYAGEVLALVGDNGAGKSTLIKVVAGVNAPDEGVIEFGGRPVSISRPHDAQRLGIATVYQDLALADNLDVVGNLFLGSEIYRWGLLDEVAMEKKARELLDTLSIKIPSVRIPVASLSGGQRQVVAISRSTAAGRTQAGRAGRADRGAGRGADRPGARPGRAAPRPRPRGDHHQPQHGGRTSGVRPGRGSAAGPQQRHLRRGVHHPGTDHRRHHRRDRQRGEPASVPRPRAVMTPAKAAQRTAGERK
ncbi:ATP-binding cassette domain-containing protein [Fodinicola feengrottensis]|uniref:ATP-binding cassette domain-containing protein n=1 Tax=Fodinicola feengrottensis TaxID=435914 RepID=UPI00244190AD|nr:ATP-binding cassette domain-containing protein [Fodinicola feengrottensis]